ncbi:MAG TPA: hypothetical protein PLK38_08810, partial [Methanoregulaceae archaeon]|nr:hypothetical protein [Methanoregulaceae archaeon]
MKNITGKSLLIFYNSELPVHAEGIIDGKFSAYCQDVIQQYLTSYLTIILLFSGSGRTGEAPLMNRYCSV